MKFSKFSSLLLCLALFALTSCKKEPIEVLPGTWSTSDGGTITFSSEGTGTVTGSDFFTPLFLSSTTEVASNFNWELVDSEAVVDTNIDLEYFDIDGISLGVSQWPVRVKNKNKVVIGFDALIISNQVELTK